jgi:hypothetical protein
MELPAETPLSTVSAAALISARRDLDCTGHADALIALGTAALVAWRSRRLAKTGLEELGARLVALAMVRLPHLAVYEHDAIACAVLAAAPQLGLSAAWCKRARIGVVPLQPAGPVRRFDLRVGPADTYGREVRLNGRQLLAIQVHR